MATLIVNQGLQVIGGRASNTADAFAAILSMSVDDSTTALAAGTTNLATPTNFLAQAFDATPTRTAQTVSHITTFATGSANFVIKRIILHFIAAGSVTNTSTTVVGGIDGQSITKTSSFSLKIQVDIAYTSP